MKHNTCKDCDRRVLGCHSTCEDYAKFRASRIERSRKIAEGRGKGQSPRARWSDSIRKRLG